MSTKISLKPGVRTAELAIREVVQQLRARTGRDFGIGSSPTNIVSQTSIRISATDEPAGAVLTRLLQETGWRMVWNLRTRSHGEMAFLNIRRVEYRKEDLLTGGEKKYYFPVNK
jgi:hypothetical protein